ncbi:hypothetical protein A9404_00510 [Halothiobacillus diazotrophicus]|uniref:Uncharacterized protein n=1 Tax=Halothiobacillus diazotrophicus TaxID=1860122 RepID=A0A191ZDX1_9GAMM|nr:hypothetical protein [Halothiobacillus diazotrophicus]ANJ66062.1 hypothetical protein A9404_00510 [Halothiobacillus diazotrophicus]
MNENRKVKNQPVAQLITWLVIVPLFVFIGADHDRAFGFLIIAAPLLVLGIGGGYLAWYFGRALFK